MGGHCSFSSVRLDSSPRQAKMAAESMKNMKPEQMQKMMEMSAKMAEAGLKPGAQNDPAQMSSPRGRPPRALRLPAAIFSGRKNYSIPSCMEFADPTVKSYPVS